MIHDWERRLNALGVACCRANRLGPSEEGIVPVVTGTQLHSLEPRADQTAQAMLNIFRSGLAMAK